MSFICLLRGELSLEVIEQAITVRDTPHDLPSNALDGIKTYGTFLSSQSKGKCKTISIG